MFERTHGIFRTHSAFEMIWNLHLFKSMPTFKDQINHQISRLYLTLANKLLYFCLFEINNYVKYVVYCKYLINESSMMADINVQSK